MSKHPRCNARHAVELHLSGNTDLPKRYGAEIRAMGGHYSECRGDMNSERFVTLPLTEDGIMLAVELIGAFRGMRRLASKKDFERGAVCVIARTPATDTMGYFTSGEALGQLSAWRKLAEEYDVRQEENRLALYEQTVAKLSAHATETAEEYDFLCRTSQRRDGSDDAVRQRLLDRADAAANSARTELTAYLAKASV